MIAFTTANAHYINDRLAVGGDLDDISPDLALTQLAELVEHGVTHILDLRREHSDEALVADLAPDISYLHLGVDDAGQTLPGAWFDAGVRWLDDALAQPDAKALVHCHMGVNRAPSMAFAYLLNHGLRVHNALHMIRAARSVAVIDYADDALAWHHRRTGASTRRRASDTAALAQWRAENHIDVEHVIRSIRGDEARRAASLELSHMFTQLGDHDVDGYRTWLFQMSKTYADTARADFDAGQDQWTLPVGRYVHDIVPGDLVLL